MKQIVVDLTFFFLSDSEKEMSASLLLTLMVVFIFNIF